MEKTAANHRFIPEADLLDHVIGRSVEEAKILVVDDEAVIRDCLKGLLSKMGFACKTAKDGAAALRHLRTDTFDIVLADIRMPNTNGLALLKKIRSDYQNVDVIMMTAYDMDYSFVDFIESGASDYISKPFHRNELLAKLKRLLRERKIKADLLYLSFHDSLTNLFNRRYFLQKLQQEVKRAKRQKRSLSCIILDMDHFKEYNDTQGHLKGDQILVTLSQILLLSVRKTVDIASRFGGDEFAILLIETGLGQACQIAERIRASFEMRRFANCTLSIGTAQLSPNEDGKDLLRRADEALFKAKEAGGNRVEKSTAGLSTFAL